MTYREQFSSRWGIILAALAMAIGAGNLWRFPRLAGQYGGAFIILWIVFLLIWSIPILLTEFSIGKKYRKGVIGAYAGIGGKSFTWIGFFITVCTLCITFYYSVVTAWALQYLGFSFSQLVSQWSGGPELATTLGQNPEFLDQHWQQISHGNYITIILYIVTITLGTILLMRGVQKGLELANKLLIPSLFFLLVLISVIALSMDNGVLGLNYMFSIDPDHFRQPKVWIEALSQSAWSTGAGWGLMMTISSYSRSGEDVTLNTFIGAFGNNTASLLAALAILPAVFALSPSESSAISYLQQGNQALTFTVIPQLFSHFPGGAYLSVLFFLAFFLAAFSSLLPMIEMFIRVLGDLGLTRFKAGVRAGFFCIIFGFPSAYSLEFFSNQDWVWGIGLIISGLFIVFAALKYGPRKFKRELIDKDSDFRVSTKYFVTCLLINIPLGIILIWWWMSQGFSDYPWFDQDGNWNVFSVYSNASILSQWIIALGIGIFLNKYLYKIFGKA